MIDFESASFTFPDGTAALADVSLSIPEGSFTCIIGANGSGKSTLAKHMCGLTAPTSGTVKVAGMDTRDARLLPAIRAKAGMVFQDPETQLVAAVVEEEVAFGPENLGLTASEIRERVDEALALTDLGGFAKRETASLSGGQKQRLALAGVLAMRPQALVLDEAGSMLDPRGRARLMDLCRSLNRQGVTLVMVTHSMEEAAAAERIVVLDAGRIVADGGPDDLLCRKELLESLGLEPPFAARLSAALRRRGMDVEPCCDEARLIGRLVQLAGRRAS